MLNIQSYDDGYQNIFILQRSHLKLLKRKTQMQQQPLIIFNTCSQVLRLISVEL